jgi:hypothetical protein
VSEAAVTAPASGFTVHACDHYIEHLAAVNAGHQLVLASEDVTNEFGVVLLRAGTPLGSYAIARMRGHRLLRAVDELLVLRRPLGADELAACYASMIGAEADLDRVDARFGGAGRVRELCTALAWSAPLLQKLTVMQLCMPRVFHRALFASWLGVLIGGERGLAAGEQSLLLQAGLLHDLGLLHIPPPLADKRSEITPGEWFEIQRHVPLGAAVVQQSMEAPPRLLRVILEHHERSDGAGYPEGRFGPDLDRLSGIVALADMLHTLRFQSELLHSHNLAECMPYLRVNRRTFDIDNYAPAGRILLAARDVATGTGDTEARRLSVQSLIDVNRSLATLLGCFAEAPALLQGLGDNRCARSLLELISQVQWVAQSSGLGGEALEQLLVENLRTARPDAGIADILATAREVFWLVRRFERRLLEETQARQGTSDAIALKDLSLRVGSELTRAWRRFEH